MRYELIKLAGILIMITGALIGTYTCYLSMSKAINNKIVALVSVYNK